MSLWKGLFYCMWMSDTLLVQESLAESISTLVHCFESMSTIVLYTSCALTTLATEWTGLDHYRINKFAMVPFLLIFFKKTIHGRYMIENVYK